MPNCSKKTYADERMLLLNLRHFIHKCYMAKKNGSHHHLMTNYKLNTMRSFVVLVGERLAAKVVFLSSLLTHQRHQTLSLFLVLRNLAAVVGEKLNGALGRVIYHSEVGDKFLDNLVVVVFVPESWIFVEKARIHSEEFERKENSAAGAFDKL